MQHTVRWSQVYSGFPKWLPYDADRTETHQRLPEEYERKLTEGHIIEVSVARLQNEHTNGRVLGQPRCKSEPSRLRRKREL